jgi:cyclopropane fatty-acyl-phospholipid synthase-like methyltransferase
MGVTAYVVGLIGLFVLTALAWRLCSRRRSLPCPAWLRWLVELDNPFARTARASAIVEHLDLEPGMRVLDVGCGPGRVAIPVARRVGERGTVVALDVQPAMLERARRKARDANLTNVDFIAADVAQDQLQLEGFDRALLVSVLGEVPNRARALEQIFAALKPGGVLSVTEVVFDPHFQSRKNVTRLAEGAGFREKACFGHRAAFTLNFEKPDPGRA